MKTKLKAASVLCASLLLSSCSLGNVEQMATSGKYADFDVAKELGIKLQLPAGLVDGEDPSDPDSVVTPPISNSNGTSVFKMRVYEKMDIYAVINGVVPDSTLKDGTVINLQEIENSIWAKVYDTKNNFLGYAKDGFLHAIDSDSELYAELPIEYGKAKTDEETYVDAYSHLVDIRKYFKVYSSTDESNEGVDLSKYDIKVSMKLSTDDTSIDEPFYDSNICMVQYDMLPQLKKAVELFKKDGYMLVIYDAYRPTSVQQRWFDIIQVHKWVADPSIGMGGIHDRGSALDVSLIDISTGKEMDMPTPMHTFTEESARTSTAMTDKQRKNMNYLLDIMVQCDYTYINSEWWHFQTADTKYYLPTDHPIDTIPLVPSETSERTN